MTNDITGKVTEIFEKEQITERLEKKKIVLEHTEAAGERYYTNHYPIEFLNKNIGLLDGVSVGDEITLSVNVKGKKTNTGKYFISIEAFRKK